MKSVRTINQYYHCSAHLKDIVDSWYTALYAPHFPSVHLHQPLVSIPSVDQLILLIFNFLTLPSTRNSLSNNLKAQAILNKILSIQFQCIYVHDAPFLKSQHSLGAILGQDPTIRIRKDFFGAKIGKLYLSKQISTCCGAWKRYYLCENPFYDQF